MRLRRRASQQCLPRAPIAATAALIVARAAAALRVEVSEPWQCEEATITVSGGQGPYTIMIAPPNSAPQLHELDEGTSELKWAVDIWQGNQFLVAASDRTGWGSGVVSGLLESRGNSSSSDQCVTYRDNLMDFSFFYSPDDGASLVTPCSNLTIGWRDDGKPPYNFIGLPLQGATFNVSQQTQPDGVGLVNLTVPLDAGAKWAIVALDAGTHGSGGVSLIETVKDGDSAAVSGCSPQQISTSIAPSSTSLSSTTKSHSPTSDSQSGIILSSGALGGIATAAAVVVILLLIGGFCLWRRGRRRPAREDIIKHESGDVDLLFTPSSPSGLNLTPSDTRRSRGSEYERLSRIDPFTGESYIGGVSSAAGGGGAPPTSQSVWASPSAAGGAPSENTSPRRMTKAELVAAGRSSGGYGSWDSGGPSTFAWSHHPHDIPTTSTTSSRYDPLSPLLQSQSSHYPPSPADPHARHPTSATALTDSFPPHLPATTAGDSAARYVRHTDAGALHDAGPSEEPDEPGTLVELPPMYSELPVRSRPARQRASGTDETGVGRSTKEGGS